MLASLLWLCADAVDVVLRVGLHRSTCPASRPAAAAGHQQQQLQQTRSSSSFGEERVRNSQALSIGWFDVAEVYHIAATSSY